LFSEEERCTSLPKENVITRVQLLTVDCALCCH